MVEPPRVLFINPRWLGHIPVYMRLYWRYFLERGWQIHNLVDNPVEAAQFCAIHFGADAGKISHSGFPDLPGAHETISAIQLTELRWMSLEKAVARIRRDEGEPSLVFHAWADLWTHPFLQAKFIRRALPLPWVGLCLHPVELRIRKTWKRRLWEMVPNLCRYALPTESRLRALRVPKLRALLLLDENVLGEARRFFPGVKIYFFPDAISTVVDEAFHLPALERLRSEGRPIIAMLGVLQRRKGFLRMMAAAEAAPGNWGFLFAGKIAWDELNPTETEFCRRFIARPPANTVLHLEFVEDEQLNALVSRSDLLFLNYEDFFHSSNVQVKAAYFRKLCLAGPKHLISERTAHYGTGWTLQDHSPATLIDFLARTDRAALEEKSRTARFDEFYRLHSTERMEKILSEIVDSAALLRRSSP